jgi:hypothetical protein
MAKRQTAPKPTCAGCFFGANGLCAVADPSPCVTFRPNSEDGLKPPRQLRFHFREQRRTHAVWTFPTAEEQAAIHAAV